MFGSSEREVTFGTSLFVIVWYKFTVFLNLPSCSSAARFVSDPHPKQILAQAHVLILLYLSWYGGMDFSSLTHILHMGALLASETSLDIGQAKFVDRQLELLYLRTD